jgi:hypothetical protein
MDEEMRYALNSAVAKLEPAAVLVFMRFADGDEPAARMALAASTAISLKRIADALTEAIVVALPTRQP